MNNFIYSTRWGLMLLMALTLMINGCTKDEGPECTPPDLVFNENGTEELSCYVNGKYWEAYAPFYLLGGLNGGYNQELKRFGLVANLRIYGNDFGHPCYAENDTIWQTIRIACIVESSNDRHNIEQQEDNFRDREGRCFKTGQGRYYVLDTSQPHYVEFVDFDTISRYATGTFEFDAINHECGDTVKVRDGRFEVLLY
jgi:hypothetical protein